MSSIATAISSIASLAILCFMVFWLYRQTQLDVFRQKLFALRDDLFDAAAAGKIDFQHPAYGMLRSTINGTIRFGHRLNLPFVVCLSAIAPPRKEGDPEHFGAKLEKVMVSLNDEQRALIRDCHHRLNLLMVEHLILGSPALLVTVITPVLFALETKHRIDRVLRAVKRPIERIDALALASADA